MRSFLRFALILCTLGLSAQNPSTATPALVGNMEAKIFHLPACKLVLKIKPENKVAFANREEAVQAGCAPCKICIK